MTHENNAMEMLWWYHIRDLDEGIAKDGLPEHDTTNTFGKVTLRVARCMLASSPSMWELFYDDAGYPIY